MRKWIVGLALGLACLCGAVGTSSARAIAIAVPRPGPDRLAGTDAVLLGRVIGFEPQDVEAAANPGAAKMSYRIAIVQVNEVIRGIKPDVKQIRVGFPAPRANAPGVGGGAAGPAIQPLPFRPGRPGFGGMQLQMGQEGLFMLAKHHEGKFFLAPNYGQFVARQNNANFENEVKTVRKLAKFLDNPKAALKSKDAEDRFLAATMLVSQYRTARAFPVKQVPIDAEESKLILLALADGDWNMNRPRTGMTPNPFQVFYQLGITPKDGWTPPNARNQQEIANAMKTWLKENAGKFRIQKMVQGQPGKGGPGIGVPVRPPVRIQPLPIRPPVRIQPLPGRLPVQIQPLPAPAPQVDPAAPPQQVRPIRGGIRIRPLPAQILPVEPERRPQPIDQ